MLNKVMLIGRLGRDPELRYSQSGLPIANLRLATDESYVDKEGNKVERTEWHSIVVFQRQAENCANYLAKGSLIYVEGSLQTRKWQDQQGQDRYTTEIKAQRVNFLERKGARDNEQRGGEYRQDGGQSYGGGQRAGGQQNYGGGQQRPNNQSYDENEDLGPAFPSEASGMDDVPF